MDYSQSKIIDYFLKINTSPLPNKTIEQVRQEIQSHVLENIANQTKSFSVALARAVNERPDRFRRPDVSTIQVYIADENKTEL